MIVKGNYTRRVGAAKASLRYYEHRTRGEDEPKRELWGQGGPLSRAEAYALLDRYRDPGVAAHRIVLSPGAGERGGDLRVLTAHVLHDLAQEHRQDLHWIAVEHRNTDDPHVHVLLCGAGERDGGLRQVRLGRGDYGRLREEGRAHCLEQAREREHLERALGRAVDRERELLAREGLVRDLDGARQRAVAGDRAHERQREREHRRELARERGRAAAERARDRERDHDRGDDFGR